MPFQAVAGLRRSFRNPCPAAVAGALIATAAAFATPGYAQSGYPTKPVHLIVPYGAGGIADVGMRILTDKLTAKLGKQFIVENRPGAGGIVAAKAGATAAPDGYTLSMTGNNYTIAAALFRSLPYDIIKDFDSVSTVAFFDVLIVTRDTSPLKSVQDMLNSRRPIPAN